MASRWSTPSATRRDSATRTASCSRARSGGADFVSYRIGFDVGGTFTDFVLQSPAGELTTAKRLTTYPDPSEACLAGLDALLAAAGVAWSDVAQAVHGTTLGSNVVIERKARGVGLLTTRGFRDVLLIGREKRYQVYDLQIEKPRPLVPRRLIGEVTERVLADGSVRTPLDEADARRAIRALAERGVTTLAICLLHAYLNPLHERRLAALVAEEAPHVTVTLSRAHDRIGAGRRGADGGRLRRAHRSPRPHRVRHGRHHRQAGADRERTAGNDDGVRAASCARRRRQRLADEHSSARSRRDRRG